MILDQVFDCQRLYNHRLVFVDELVRELVLEVIASVFNTLMG